MTTARLKTQTTTHAVKVDLRGAGSVRLLPTPLRYVGRTGLRFLGSTLTGSHPSRWTGVAFAPPCAARGTMINASGQGGSHDTHCADVRH